ncbi:uncharacterized protein LOC103570602 isoform X2 [Microplitis demolitor]|uniref:uncharacterized protein LOC103570602 isoform X2 n=1 Tax=Microplitis demolitor TaxID=69319 RepID=UPI0004CD844E|nr:uncharacterized protein LOC103570602 isoform X2 [Microplitis demolitor]
MADQSDRSQLPPGWECRYDIRSGRPYFINHFNCSTSWEDPRVRYWQYAQYTHEQNSTATSSSNGNSHEAIPLQDLKTPMSTTRSISATTNKFGDMTIGSPTPLKNMETSFTQSSDVELQVAKINAIFPTVSDTHIRLLLKKYLKNVFPKVDETLLLDILEQSDNNVQKASEKLIEQGYEKRNPTGPSKSLIRPQEDIHKVNKVTPTPPPRMKSVEEKNKLKTKLMEKYKSVPDRVIALAMDSVDYDEEKAVHILDIMIAEEAVQPLRTSSSHSSRSDDRKDSPPITEAIKLTASPVKKILNKDDADKSKRAKNKIETQKISRGTSTAEDSEYKSPYITKPIGANSDLAKGPDNDLLLPDYAPWAGPDSSLLTKETIGTKSLAVGRDLSLISGSRSIAKGPSADLRKGPLRGLAQGSIYSQRNAANTESRGK